MPSTDWPVRLWGRLWQLDARSARRMEAVNLVLSSAPLALYAVHAPTAVVAGAVVVWAVAFALVLPSSIRCCVVAWRAGTRAKWQARILRAHVAELSELTASLDEGQTL